MKACRIEIIFEDETGMVQIEYAMTVSILGNGIFFANENGSFQIPSQRVIELNFITKVFPKHYEGRR